MHKKLNNININKLERVKRIELSQEAWKATALPLSYTRLLNKLNGGGNKIRTYVDIRQLIYSQPPLATRAFLLKKSK